MLSRVGLFRSLRKLHHLRGQDPVEDEYRGWSWDRPPVRPRAYLGLGVSDVAYRYCPTRRDVYLRRMGVAGEPSGPLQNGNFAHLVFHAAAEDVRRELVLGRSGWEAYERIAARAERRLRSLGVEPRTGGWLLDLYKRLALTWCSEEWSGPLSEYRVDGSLLGLSRNLRVDGLAELGVVVELKFGKPHEHHRLALAGYALALEAEMEVPVDYGVLVYVVQAGRHARVSWEPVYVSTALRGGFLEARDELIDLLLSGREPPRPASCPESCPYRGVC